MNVEKKINELYGGKLRVRACGFCFKNQKVLLLKHKSKLGDLWLPPGGGLEYGETIKTAIEREFLEETHLKIKTEEFIFLTEFIDLPLHAIELFHKVSIISGVEKVGSDPESNDEEQIIEDLKWFSYSEIEQLSNQEKHSALQSKNLLKIKHYFKLEA